MVARIQLTVHIVWYILRQRPRSSLIECIPQKAVVVDVFTRGIFRRSMVTDPIDLIRSDPIQAISRRQWLLVVELGVCFGLCHVNRPGSS